MQTVVQIAGDWIMVWTVTGMFGTVGLMTNSVE
jgi:hypothetical protein